MFRSADVLLHPTRWDGQPVTILEALAFGLPVVATSVGAIPDTIRSGVDGYLMRRRAPRSSRPGCGQSPATPRLCRILDSRQALVPGALHVGTLRAGDVGPVEGA